MSLSVGYFEEETCLKITNGRFPPKDSRIITERFEIKCLHVPKESEPSSEFLILKLMMKS
jgi:hypothetical protein